MPHYPLTELEAIRLEKGRKLLQESEEHRGCRDLQLFVESQDLTIEVHRIFLNDSGERRPGLSEMEMQQGLNMLVLMLLRSLSAVTCQYNITEPAGIAIADAINRLGDSPLPWGALLASIIGAGFDSLIKTPTTPLGMFKDILKKTEVLTHPNFPAAIAAAELHQRSVGCSPVLSAADMHRLALHSQQEAATVLLQRQPEAAEAQQWLATALSANRQLLQLDLPANAAVLHMKRGNIMVISNRRPEASDEYRSALREAHKSHSVAVHSAQQVAMTLLTGAAGPCWNVEEVRGLVKTMKTALAKCKWMPPSPYARIKSRIAEVTSILREETARRPGAMLPAIRGEVNRTDWLVSPECSGCGQTSNSLKKCSSCHVAAYCSRACQVQHWKQGGHKQECAQLKAGRSGGAGSSRS